MSMATLSSVSAFTIAETIIAFYIIGPCVDSWVCMIKCRDVLYHMLSKTSYAVVAVNIPLATPENANIPDRGEEFGLIFHLLLHG